MTETLRKLESTIDERAFSDPATSYVAKLLRGGIPLVAKKLSEEAAETVIAALLQDREALTHEAADLLFHLLVLLRGFDISLADVEDELARREAMSGLDEKAARAS